MKQYRILFRNNRYFVQKKRRFLFWKYWSTFKELYCDPLDCVEFDKPFFTESDAEEFIREDYENTRDRDVIKTITLP